MIDERFVMHRYKATRLATAVGVVLIAGFFFYDYIVNRSLRWDLFTVLAAMGAVKVAAMLYYRRTN